MRLQNKYFLLGECESRDFHAWLDVWLFEQKMYQNFIDRRFLTEFAANFIFFSTINFNNRGKKKMKRKKKRINNLNSNCQRGRIHYAGLIRRNDEKSIRHRYDVIEIKPV